MTNPSKEYRDLYHAAIAAARAKEIDRARKLFLAAVTLDERQKSGWLALARLESDLDTKANYYRRVLDIDPKDRVARAFMDGMRRQSWYRSRWAVGLLGLVALFIGGMIALLAAQPVSEGNDMLPTSAMLPSLTPGNAVELAVPLSQGSPEIAASTEAIESLSPTPSPDIPVQATFLSLDVPTIEAFVTQPEPEQQADAPFATPLPLVTTVFNPPVPTMPTSPPGGSFAPLVTAAPSATNAAASTATPQPLFMDITEPPPTSLPSFATPTLDYQGDFNTEAPPPDQTFPEDPNSGGMRQP